MVPRHAHPSSGGGECSDPGRLRKSCVFVHSKSEIREFLIVNSRSGGTVFARGETGNGRKGKGKRKSLKQVDYLADLVPEQL